MYQQQQDQKFRSGQVIYDYSTTYYTGSKAGKNENPSIEIIASLYDDNWKQLSEHDPFIIDTGYTSGLWLGEQYIKYANLNNSPIKIFNAGKQQLDSWTLQDNFESLRITIPLSKDEDDQCYWIKQIIPRSHVFISKTSQENLIGLYGLETLKANVNSEMKRIEFSMTAYQMLKKQ